jgi:hypothetical protein
VNRVKVVEQALAGRINPVYLEIGVWRGFAFRRISADEKIAVDPTFKVSAFSRKRAEAKARSTHYFETTSEGFFASQTALLEQRGIDVALIDGLHSYQQVVRDIEHTVRYLRNDGVIVLHDCNPANASIGYPARSYDDFRAKNRMRSALLLGLPPWSGDVWKAIVHLRSARHDLRIAVLNCDRGVGVVRKGRPDSQLSYSAEQIESLNYGDLAADRDRLLNLKPPAYVEEFLAQCA